MDSVKSIITALYVFFETAFSYLTVLSNISKKKKTLAHSGGFFWIFITFLSQSYWDLNMLFNTF